MKSETTTLASQKNQLKTNSSDEEDDIIVPRKRTKRIIQNSDSDSSDDDEEDNLPLNRRFKKTTQVKSPVAKRVKTFNANKTLEDTPRARKLFDLTERTKEREDLGIREPTVIIKQNAVEKAPLKKPASSAIKPLIESKKESSPFLPRKVVKEPLYEPIRHFKAPSPIPNRQLKAPLPVSNNKFKTPLPVKNNEFKAPAPISNDEFKTPTPVSKGGLKAPASVSNGGFKAPTPVSNNEFKAPAPVSNDGFKAPASNNEFKAPLPVFNSVQPTASISSRLTHYMKCICEELDEYNQTKKKQTDSLLVFREEDDLATLDITVMRKFGSLTLDILKHSKNLDSIDMDKFGKVVKLMENSIIVATELDMIEFYGKNPTENKESALKMLTLISDALETCCMIFDILTTYKLDKKFLSRNLITNCLHFIKNQLDFTVYPLIDISNVGQEVTLLTTNAHAFLDMITTLPKEKHLLSTFIPSIIRFFRRAFTLILSEELDDDVLVIIAYICMAPFFHDYSETNRSILLESDDDKQSFNPYEHLKFFALDILKHIFSSYPKHRRWIFEEILTSLGSLTTMDGIRRYRLRDNRSIHVISALFMQLVQCCSSITDKSSHINWYRKWNIKYQKVSKRNDADQIKALDDKLVQRASNAWRTCTEAASNSASFFLEFLMSKCKSRKMDSYSIAEYRHILDQTLQDIMTVFNDPEWPVAELVMRVFSRILLSLLQEDRSDQYLKSLAIEWLGTLCTKIKVGCNKLSGGHESYTPEWMYSLNETFPLKVDINTNVDSIELVDQCRKKLFDYITEEKVNKSVLQFYLCNWGFIESVTWAKANKGWEVQEKKPAKKAEEGAETVEAMEEDSTVMETSVVNNDLIEDSEPKWSKDITYKLEDTCKYYWLSCLGLETSSPISTTQFEFPDMSRSDYALLAELLASRQTLYTSFNFILSELLMCLEKDAVVYRTKALRAIGKIAIEVPELMEEQRIRTAVVQRVHDSSPSVRDAAVDVLAKYMGRLDTVPVKLYEIVSGRIMDTAVAVRKRLVKLLRDLYFKFTDPEIKTDIASKLILRIGDSEISINQLSLKATQEILFLPFKEIEKDGNDYFGYSYANSPKNRKKRINDLTSIITGAVSKLDSSISVQNATLSKIIEKTVAAADEKAALWYDKVFQWIVDSLFDRMILLEEEDNSLEFINCLATVYSFTKSCPDLLRESHISMLQPYLSISEDAEWTKAHYVLSIYRDVLPFIKYHDPEFIQSIERLLMQLLGRCPLGLISSGVSCLCVIVDTISQHYNVLIKMLGSCISKLRQVQQILTHGQESENQSFAGVLKMLLISGLLCQNFEFDKKREEEPKKMEALNLVYRGKIDILVFEVLKFFTGEIMDDLGDEGIQMRMTALQGLGYFFASYPTFMISPESTNLMDKIFDEGSIELQIRLMLVFQEFLSAEEKRIGKRELAAGDSLYTKTIDIDTLLGNTEEYAELGVNGSLMQRYLCKILSCALSESSELRYAAFEVVSAVVHQGLAHPVMCMPAIVAAETSPDVVLRTKAYYLHRYAHDKYRNLLYSHMSEYLSTSYQYQKILCGAGNVLGYGKRGGDAKVDPVLGVTYSVLKDKKKPKFDFLTSLVKAFEFDLKSTTSEDIDIGYLKYLSENMIHLTLSTTDDVLNMVYIMDRILMTLGTDLLSYVHFLKKQGIVNANIDEDSEKQMGEDFVVASKLAIALCILLYAKNLLVELYDIPDDEIREFNPNVKHKARDVTVDSDIEAVIHFDELMYFQNGQLTKQSASDACLKFEYLIMNDTTAVIVNKED